MVGEVGQLPLMLRAMVAIGEPRAQHHMPRFGNKMGLAGRLMPPSVHDMGAGWYLGKEIFVFWLASTAILNI